MHASCNQDFPLYVLCRAMGAGCLCKKPALIKNPNCKYQA